MSAVLAAPRQRPAAAKKSQSAKTTIPDRLVTLWDVPWAQYVKLDDEHGHGGTRLTYCEGILDIMTVSADHERIKGNLSHLIASYCFDEEIEFVSEGSATRRKKGSRGNEPDDSFIFGGEPKPRPDLAVEIVLTSGGVDKLEYYAPFAIPEIWIWESSGLSVFVFDGARYKKARKSKLLPGFDVAAAGELATCPTASQAVREFRKRAAKRG